MANLIYLGPTLQSLGFLQNAVFNGGVPVGLLGVYNGSADIQLLTVTLDAAVITLAEVQTPGTPQNDAYYRLLKLETNSSAAQPSEGGGTGGSIELPDPYETPVPSKQKQSDGTIVNPADAFTPEGTLKVVLQNGGAGVGGGAEELVGAEYFNGSGNMIKNFSGPMKGFVISNDHTADLTITTAGFGTIPVLGDPTGNKKGEVFNERLEPFSSVIINATGPFRAYGLKSPAAALDTTAPANVSSVNVTNTT